MNRRSWKGKDSDAPKIPKPKLESTPEASVVKLNLPARTSTDENDNMSPTERERESTKAMYTCFHLSRAYGNVVVPKSEAAGVLPRLDSNVEIANQYSHLYRLMNSITHK